MLARGPTAFAALMQFLTRSYPDGTAISLGIVAVTVDGVNCRPVKQLSESRPAHFRELE